MTNYTTNYPNTDTAPSAVADMRRENCIVKAKELIEWQTQTLGALTKLDGAEAQELSAPPLKPEAGGIQTLHALLSLALLQAEAIACRVNGIQDEIMSG